MRISRLQWNLSIVATLGEQHDGHYMGVAVLQGFGYYGSLCSKVHSKAELVAVI